MHAPRCNLGTLRLRAHWSEDQNPSAMSKRRLPSTEGASHAHDPRTHTRPGNASEPRAETLTSVPTHTTEVEDGRTLGRTTTVAEASAQQMEALLERRNSRRRYAPAAKDPTMAALDTRSRHVQGGAGACGATAVDAQAAEAMVR